MSYSLTNLGSNITAINGNIGIGTNNPFSRLHLHKQGASQDVRMILSDGTTGASATNGFQMFKASDGLCSLWNYENRDLRIGTSNYEVMRAYNSNIGIGKTVANYRLDVNGTVNATEFRLNGNVFTVIERWKDSSTYNQINGSKFIYYNDGNIGIGTTVPEANLDIQGTAPRLRLFGSNFQDDAILSFRESTDLYGFDVAYIGKTDKRLYIRSFLNSITPIYGVSINRNSGNVGIGTSQPDTTAKLKVQGNCLVSGSITEGTLTLENKYAGKDHTHTKSQISDFSHQHPISEITNLQSTLDGKSNTGHNHSIGEITNLQSALDGKSATGHGHSINQITNLQSALDGKSNTGHGHSISDITNLQSALDDKSSTQHHHDYTYLSLSGGTLTGNLNINANAVGSICGGTFYINHTTNPSTNWWRINVGDGTSPDELNSVGNLNFYAVYSLVGFVEDDVSGSWKMNFTGQHRCYSDTKDTYSSNYIGYLVSCTGKYKEIGSKYGKNNIKQNININDALPYVELTSKAYDKNIFGVISDRTDDEQGAYSSGHFISVYPKDVGDDRVVINSIGEGSMWVCNYNGSIEMGDYLCSSYISGLAMRQDDDLLHNYTCGKATMNCDFNPQLIPVEIIKQETYYVGSNIMTSNVLDADGYPVYEYQLDESSNIVLDYEYEVRDIVYNGSNYKQAFIGVSYKMT